jgi:preprotein translocase subunit YajC
MFISPAFAQAAGEAAKGPSTLMSLLPLVVIFALFYILILRPQSKRMREHNEQISALKVGDKVVTSGGIFATVVKVGEGELTVEIAPNMQVRVQKFSVTAQTDVK